MTGWRLEFYEIKTSASPKRWKEFEFAAVLARADAAKLCRSTHKLRIVPPTNASLDQLRELAARGIEIGF